MSQKNAEIVNTFLEAASASSDVPRSGPPWVLAARSASLMDQRLVGATQLGLVLERVESLVRSASPYP